MMSYLLIPPLARKLSTIFCVVDNSTNCRQFQPIVDKLSTNCRQCQPIVDKLSTKLSTVCRQFDGIVDKLSTAQKSALQLSTNCRQIVDKIVDNLMKLSTNCRQIVDRIVDNIVDNFGCRQFVHQLATNRTIKLWVRTSRTSVHSTLWNLHVLQPECRITNVSHTTNKISRRRGPCLSRRRSQPAPPSAPSRPRPSLAWAPV